MDNSPKPGTHQGLQQRQWLDPRLAIYLANNPIVEVSGYSASCECLFPSGNRGSDVSSFRRNYAWNYHFPTIYAPPDQLPQLIGIFHSWVIDWVISLKQEESHVEEFALSAIMTSIHVHVFQDGNKRTSRLLCNIILLKFNIPAFEWAFDTRDDRERYSKAVGKALHRNAYAEGVQLYRKFRIPVGSAEAMELIELGRLVFPS
jgi:hypothetical protein